MTGLGCAWTSIPMLFVLATLVWASTVLNQKQQQQMQQHQQQQQQQQLQQHHQQHPRKHNSHTNQACPGGFQIFGSYCLHYDNEHVIQALAVDYCTSLGATLTYPINDDDIDDWREAVYDAAHIGYTSPWGGASQQADGQWTWVDGTQVPADAWAPGRPNGNGPCTFVDMRSDNGGGPLRDGDCSNPGPTLCQVTLEATTTTDLPETTTPTVPSETTILTERPTITTGGQSSCYSCMSCPDVDDTTYTEPKHEHQSCFTATYDNGDNVMRGVSPEFHEDGDCQLINYTVFCFCNQHLCNNLHALMNIDSLLIL